MLQETQEKKFLLPFFKLHVGNGITKQFCYINKPLDCNIFTLACLNPFFLLYEKQKNKKQKEHILCV